MSKVKIVMLSLLAVFALSAAASATASAAGTHQWFINGTLLGSGVKEEVQGNTLPYVQETQFEMTISGLGLHAYCQTTVIPGGDQNVIEGGSVGKAKVRLEFDGCAAFDVTGMGVSERLSGCKAGLEPVLAEAEGELINAGVLDLEGEPIAKFEIVKANAKESSCAIEGKYEIKGSLVCVIPHYGVPLYVHVLECTPGGSSLVASVGGAAETPIRLYLGVGISPRSGDKLLSS
jgi:hypothetical protein